MKSSCDTARRKQEERSTLFPYTTLFRSKGVQKKIIEVNHPDSLYFERAVFYLKPGVTQLPQQLSRADADALLREAAPDKAEKRFWLRTVLLVLLSCLGTAAVCLLLL